MYCLEVWDAATFLQWLHYFKLYNAPVLFLKHFLFSIRGKKVTINVLRENGSVHYYISLQKFKLTYEKNLKGKVKVFQFNRKYKEITILIERRNEYKTILMTYQSPYTDKNPLVFQTRDPVAVEPNKVRTVHMINF